MYWWNVLAHFKSVVNYIEVSAIVLLYIVQLYMLGYTFSVYVGSVCIHCSVHRVYIKQIKCLHFFKQFCIPQGNSVGITFTTFRLCAGNHFVVSNSTVCNTQLKNSIQQPKHCELNGLCFHYFYKQSRKTATASGKS